MLKSTSQVKSEEANTISHGGASAFARQVLSSRYMPVWAGLLGILLTLPSLGTGLLLDDYHHKLLMMDSESVVRVLESPVDMFRFFDGDTERMAELVDYGLCPWWTYMGEGLRGAFWRPLASTTHWLDYVLWPDCPALMHAQSVLWYGAVAMAAAFLYRRFMSAAWVAGLAVLMFAIDDAHGTPAGFLANRNALMATFFGIVAVIVHDRWRRDNWRIGMVVGPLLLGASLMSAEAGIATCAYLGAHAVFIDRGRWGRRVAALLPYVVVVVVWRILWTRLGYGIVNVGLYVDPLREPLGYVSAVKNRAPFLLLGQFAFPPAGIALMLEPGQWRVLWRAALAFIAVTAAVFYPLLRRDRTTRFWAVGMILSVLPICATFPDDRLLLFVGIGGMGLVGQLLEFVFGRRQWRPKVVLWRVASYVVATIFILSHLVVAPPALAFRSAYPLGPKQLLDKMMINRPLEVSVEEQDLVIVNPPIAFFACCSVLTWAGEEWPVPRRLRVLTSSLFETVRVHRPDERSLVVRPAYGYYAWVLDGLFRTEKHPFHVGDRIELTGMTVEITKLTGDGRPAEAAFTFSVPLEDSSLRWLQYKNGQFVPFYPPAAGESMELAGENPFGNLAWNDQNGKDSCCNIPKESGD
ncbi:MAG: hypothetical protein ACYS4W_07090 [Planctomycetota bacterium]|jgi:hypothetical protein